MAPRPWRADALLSSPRRGDGVQAPHCGIRRATLADVGALVGIEDASFPGNRLDRRRFRYLLARAHGVTLVDAGDSADAAPLRGYILQLFRTNSPVARIYSIATHPAHLGQGVAGALLDAAERLAVAHGYTRQRLEIRADNAPSLTLFARHGYRIFGRHPGYYHDGMDAVRLERTLSD